jgi:hypothetical protein
VSYNQRLILRVWLNGYPFATFFGMVMIVAFFFAYILYIAERKTDYYAFLDEALSKENTYEDYVWLSIISLLTVGYGDLYPTTHFGRMIVIVIAFSGLFMTATFIGIVNEWVELTGQEKNIVEILRNYRKYEKLRNLCAELIQLGWRLKNKKSQFSDYQKAVMIVKYKNRRDNIISNMKFFKEFRETYLGKVENDEEVS